MFNFPVSSQTVLVAFITVSALSIPRPALSVLFRTNSPSPTPSLAATNEGLLVAGLSFRLPIRASRWRFGAFARGCPQSNAEQTDASTGTTTTFVELQQRFLPITPPLSAEEATAQLEGASPIAVDQTLSTHPIVFFHMPNLPAATVSFTIQNEEGSEQLYETSFEWSEQEPGLVGIEIPDTEEPLEIGQIYAWQALATSACPNSASDFRLHTGGWVERVSATGQLATVNQVSMRDRPSLYAEAGIWTETVSTLAKLRLENPTDMALNESWASLMESVDLNEFASAPILHIHTDADL